MSTSAEAEITAIVDESNVLETARLRLRTASQKARENQATQDGAKNATATTNKVTTRASRPTTTSGSQIGEGKYGTHGDNDVAVWQRKVLEMLGYACNEIKNLKNVINEQQDTIKDLSERLDKLIVEIKKIKAQRVEEVKQMHEKLDAIMECPAFSAVVNTSPRPSYADVAKTPPNSAPENLNSLSSMGTTPSTMADTLYCTIDTSRVANDDIDKASVSAIRKAVENEIRTTKGETSWRCRAVTKDPKNITRIKIACRDEAEQQIIKQAAETKIAPGIRVMRDELYPIKVDNVNRLAVLEDGGEIRNGATETLSQENECTVAKIAWLSKKEVPKAYGSMVVYVTKGSDARRLLAEGFFHAGGESGCTEVFEHRPRPVQCFKCQELGHKAFQCKNNQRCAKCAKEGHHHGSCSEAIPKCIPCGGPHESFSRSCPKLFPTNHE
jgi:hypothetical protein